MLMKETFDCRSDDFRTKIQAHPGSMGSNADMMIIRSDNTIVVKRIAKVDLPE